MFTIIVPTKQDNNLIDSVKKQASSDDQIIITNLPKHPMMKLDSIIRDAKSNKIILLNALSERLNDGFIDTFKDKYDPHIVYARRHDDPIDRGFTKSAILNLMKDDCICFCSTPFRTLRDLSPQSQLFDVIKEIIKIKGNNIHIPIIRNESVYSDSMIRWREEKKEIKRLKKENERLKNIKENDEKNRLKRERLDSINEYNGLKDNIPTTLNNRRRVKSIPKKMSGIYKTPIIKKERPIKEKKTVKNDWNTWMLQ